MTEEEKRAQLSGSITDTAGAPESNATQGAEGGASDAQPTNASGTTSTATPNSGNPSGVGNDAVAIVGEAGKPTEGIRIKSDGQAAVLTPAEEAVMGYDKQIETLHQAAEASRPETEEERKKREKRERSKKIIGAIGDGLAALSNLYFTTQYAPNAYNANNSILAKTNERIEALKAERKANEDRYNNFMLKLGDVYNAKAQTLREMKAQQEAQKLAREKAQRDAELHKFNIAVGEAKGRKENALADKAGYEATASKAVADSAPTMQKAKLETEQARKGSYQASASASRAAAANSMASARAHDRNKPSEFSAWDEFGHEHKFSTKEAADRYAKQHDTWQPEDIVSSTKTDSEDAINGKSSKTATTTKEGGHPIKPKGKGYGDDNDEKKSQGKGKGYGD